MKMTLASWCKRLCDASFFLKNNFMLLKIQCVVNSFARKPAVLVLLMLQLTICSLFAQDNQKKDLKVEDYSKWRNVLPDKISDNGHWVSYRTTRAEKQDSLFVNSTIFAKAYGFSAANRTSFLGNDFFAYQSAQGLHLLNLASGEKETIAGATDFTYTKGENKLLVLLKKGNESSLVIRDPNGSNREQILGVNEFVLDPLGRQLLYTTVADGQHFISILDLTHKNKKTVLLTGKLSLSQPVWQVDGKAIAFMQKSEEAGSVSHSIYFYNLLTQKLSHYDPTLAKDFPKDSLYIPNNNYDLNISDDMQKVFFTVYTKAKPKTAETSSDVQVWNGNAKSIYPHAVRNYKRYLTVWYPDRNSAQIISNDILHDFMLSGDQQFAILSNSNQYEPQYKDLEGPRDYYTVNLSTGERKLSVKKIDYPVASPSGKYLTYFHEQNWWVYDIAKDIHTNLTKGIPQAFFHNKKKHPNVENPYPVLGWTKDDKEILLCDEFDIWQVRADGTSPRRLTKGRETKTQFRIAGAGNSLFVKKNYNGFVHNRIDLSKGLLLETMDDQGQASYFEWSLKSNQKIVFAPNSVFTRTIQSADGGWFAYIENGYELPPRLMVKSRQVDRPKVLFQSNPQHQEFNWGRSEIMTYKNAKGKSLRAMLYYPANYDSEKKYPMIVCIYEKMVDKLQNRYLFPSEYTGQVAGVFNIANFTTQGYFVLAPDISYELGDPGISATDCVVSVTKEVIGRGLVKPDKIGLLGHSFGGYETDFIITQTNLFAAAFAGSAITNNLSFYFNIGDFGPNIWRVESQQMRMGKSYFEDREGYRRNSPIEHADKITTPLLSWTGDSDNNVPWTQSTEFYLALRRLDKPHIMLVYPKEAHVLAKSKNKKDLSVRTHEWFDYHLKDVAPAAWIKMGLKANN